MTVKLPNGRQSIKLEPFKAFGGQSGRAYIALALKLG